MKNINMGLLEINPSQLPIFSKTFTLYSDDFDLVPTREPDYLTDRFISLSTALYTSSDQDLGDIKSEILSILGKRDYINLTKITKILDFITSKARNHIEIDANDYQMVSLPLIKLITHLISGYTDNLHKNSEVEHFEIAKTYSQELYRLFPLDCVVLGGSLINPASNLWHPFFSDIDIIPIRKSIEDDFPTESLLEWYKSIHPIGGFIYINYGAQTGIADILREPLDNLFVVNNVKELTQSENRHVRRLFKSGKIILEGSPKIIEKYFTSLPEIQFRANIRSSL